MFEFAERKYYRLADVRDLFGRSKAHMSDLYRTRVGCITPYIRLRPYSADVEGLCLYACFVQDAEGNFVNRHLRTSLVSEIVEADDGGVEVITANSIYVFEPATPLEPEFREAKNILELWLGKGDHRFGKGVHYDTDGNPHVLQLSIHLGTIRDSFLICHEDNPGIIVARYFSGYQGVEFYDTIYGQQDYTAPMLIHNTADYELSIRFQFAKVEHRIEPGGEHLIHPPKRPERKRTV